MDIKISKKIAEQDKITKINKGRGVRERGGYKKI